jgi:hypothetical protein
MKGEIVAPAAILNRINTILALGAAFSSIASVECC